MDPNTLLDQLDELIHNAQTIPLTGRVVIDRDKLYELLDQLRVALPS